ncbi:hypothetical protein PFISCL1PPCAC_23124 [Pristionchus fissidentatus]|uniref:G-protein coupled receptors family 1 profile domain-containing protein n=1 Tax=Pristionchus fissidentatus TaxID=1538716 RepID=A0AAV5WPS8_9BILA|nr:hypothetical protein PFISCL1PPCAC_23124 [Pristionchus fissidentatus]
MVDSDDVSCEVVLEKKMTPTSVIATIIRSNSRIKAEVQPVNRAAMQPMWRRRLRGKLFRSTLLIVAAHFLFWFPYNFSALVAYLSVEYKEMIALHAYFLNDLQILITLVNPILYAIVK